jgi:diaminopimelate epimerase
MASQLELVKYEALGNDFLVLVDPEGRWQLSEQLARSVCDRHRGFGADGLLRLSRAQGALGTDRARAANGANTLDRENSLGGENAPDGASTASGANAAVVVQAAIRFELRNADGSEAEMSGNGLRCLAQAAIEAGVLSAGAGDSFGVETPAGLRGVTVRELRGGRMWASTEMGAPKVMGGPRACNVDDGQVLVDVGNPHLVVLGPDPAGVDVAGLGKALSDQYGKATAGLNVEFVALGPGRDVLTMRVWERGVGETEACGTGSVAAAAALFSLGRVGRKVTVRQPGGEVEVELRSDGMAILTGPSRRVGKCALELP